MSDSTSFKISGKVTTAEKVKEGNGKNGGWKQQQFTVETNEQYPQQVSMSNMKSGEYVKYFTPVSVGDSVDVEFNITQREYNGKKYNDIKVWKIENKNSFAKNDNNSQVPDDDLPF